jgi:membrane-bound ClpP family serine protease
METSPERHGEQLKSPEQSAELAEMAREKLQNLEAQSEKSPENKAEKIETARHEIERQPEAEPEPDTSEQAKDTRPVTRLDKEVSYKHTMQTLQRHMSPATRTFSKVIHNPAVDKVSDVAGKTVLRPSVTVGATGAALLFGGTLYIAARYYGFALSGSEFILALLVGGLFGLLLEVLFKGFRAIGNYFKR